MKILGLTLGQLGDAVIQLPTFRTLKELYPGATITCNLARRFQTIAPVLLWSRDIDNLHLTDTYDGWPGTKDEEYLAAEGFDLIFHGMPQHRDDRWWFARHQVLEVADMYSIPAPSTTQIELECPYPITKTRSVVIAPVGGGGASYKSLGPELYQAIVDVAHSKAYDVYQLTYPGEVMRAPAGVMPTNTTYEGSVLKALASTLYVGVDTGMTWCLSAFKHPTLGLYSNEGYGEHVRNIQPTNPNARYLSAPQLSQIPLDEVRHMIEDMLA